MRDGTDTTGRPAHPSNGNAPLTIAVDFDGVLFDQVPHIIEGFRRLYGIDLDPVHTWTWNLEEHPAVVEAELGPDDVVAVFEWLETNPDFHRQDLLDPHALHVMQSWRDAGHEVDIVTSRRADRRTTTELFLEHHGVPHDELHMEVWPKVGYDVLVDDLPPNVEAAAKEGTTALLFSQPYNRYYETDGNPRRVEDWAEVEMFIGSIRR